LIRKPGTQEPGTASDTDGLQFGVWRFLLMLSDSLRHYFLQVFHIFGGRIMMLYFGAFARDVSRKERLALEYTVQDFFHSEGQTVGLGEAGDLRFAIASAQNRGELAIAIHAL